MINKKTLLLLITFITAGLFAQGKDVNIWEDFNITQINAEKAMPRIYHLKVLLGIIII